jgi:hypothetical protein
MTMHVLIIDFALAYGVNEALILTELCRRTHISGDAAIPFSAGIGKEVFTYLTLKQIRLGLCKLRAAKAIQLVKQPQATMDRSYHYAIAEPVYQKYIQALVSRRLALQDSYEQALGAF